jgi:hypothetical protein
MTNKLKTIASKKASTQHNVAARVPRRWYSVDTYFDYYLLFFLKGTNPHTVSPMKPGSTVVYHQLTMNSETH